MKIMVTGGAGFIGLCFIRLAVQNTGFDIVNVDKLTYAGNPQTLASDYAQNYEHRRHELREVTQPL